MALCARCGGILLHSSGLATVAVRRGFSGRSATARPAADFALLADAEAPPPHQDPAILLSILLDWIEGKG